MSDAGFTLARRLRAGENVATGWCGMGAPVVAETVARAGFPAVTLDQQHGMFDMPSTMAGLAAIRAAGAAPVVRIPLGGFAVASRVLDLGAEGVIAPMINTVDDARAFVSATKFPPVGERSWGPTRATALMDLSGERYLAEANDGTVTFAMIETRQALDNVDAILAVPGIDAVFIGPSDMSISLSAGKTLDPHSAEVERTIDSIAAAARKAGKIAAAYCADSARANALFDRGYRFCAVASDTGFLRSAALAAFQALKR